jgi:hypothetical protein
MRLGTWAVLALASGGLACAPQEDPVSLGRLVPTEAEGYGTSGPDHTYDRTTIFDYIDGAGEVYLQYGFRSVLVRDLARANQPAIAVQLFDMGRPEDAFGIFSLEREDEDAGIGSDSEYGGGLLRFWKGRYFVCAAAERETPEAKTAILALGRAVASSIPEGGERPTLLGGLPEEGLAATRIRFFHGSFGLASRYPAADGKLLGLGQDTDVVLATYRLGGTSPRILLIRYPEAARAAAALEAFSRGTVPPLGADGTARSADGKWNGARRSGKTLAAVFVAETREDLVDLLTRTSGRLEGMPWAR